MLGNITERVIVGILILLLVVASGAAFKYSQDAKASAEQARELGFDVLNAKAEADNSRKVGEAYRRLAVQQAFRADSLDRALGIQRQVNVQAQFTIDSLFAEGVVGVEYTRSEPAVLGEEEVPEPEVRILMPDTAIRHIRWKHERRPFRVEVEALVPPRGGPPPTANIRVGIEPFNVGVRVGCTAVDEATGLREVVAAVVPPAWARVEVSQAQADRGVCNPPPPPAPGFLERLKIAGPPALIVGGTAFVLGVVLSN